jgi:hypothetical protein
MRMRTTCLLVDISCVFLERVVLFQKKHRPPAAGLRVLRLGRQADEMRPV